MRIPTGGQKHTMDTWKKVLKKKAREHYYSSIFMIMDALVASFAVHWLTGADPFDPTTATKIPTCNY